MSGAAARAAMMGMFPTRPWRVPRHIVVRDCAGLLADTMIDDGPDARPAFSPASDGTPLTCRGAPST